MVVLRLVKSTTGAPVAGSGCRLTGGTGRARPGARGRAAGPCGRFRRRVAGGAVGGGAGAVLIEPWADALRRRPAVEAAGVVAVAVKPDQMIGDGPGGVDQPRLLHRLPHGQPGGRIPDGHVVGAARHVNAG